MIFRSSESLDPSGSGSKRTLAIEDEMIWLVGAGQMAQSYSAVLKELGRAHTAIGRSAQSAQAFTQKTGIECRLGGLKSALAEMPPPSTAIVAVNVDQLAQTALDLLGAGCTHVLLEKPGGVDAAEIERVAQQAEACGANVRVAYNRRFYASVLAAQNLVAEDGGVTSMTFEFTEVSDVVVKLPYPPHVLANWLLANSTHVIDTAFYLAGDPQQIFPLTAGSLNWHPRAARFAGAGVTQLGALFSYHADWDAPGRWGIEANTLKRRLILRPMEQLQVQHRGQFSVAPHGEEDELDRRFKPGLYRQVKAFLEGTDEERLLSIADHARRASTIYATLFDSLLKPQA